MFLSKRVSSFLTVIEAKSFSRAAELLYVSSPALIQQINLLEDEIGVPLLIRTKRGVQPTAAGEVFYDALGGCPVAVTVGDDGWAEFRTEGGSASIWVRAGAFEDLVVNE